MKSDAPDPKIIVWFKKEFIPLGEANVNILTHALNYGTGVFEGIRGYYDESARELNLFRVAEHYRRWKRNAGLLRIEIPESPDDLSAITADLCRRNKFHCNVYVRPLAFKASARIGVHADDNDASAIVVVPFGAYFDVNVGLKAGVTSWRRVEDNAIPGRGKISGSYANSVLAGDEARRSGHDEAIFLTEGGHVAEAAASNIFIVRDGVLITPPVTDNVLEGITRDAITELSRRELNLQVVERSVDRSELYICDEIFLAGTAVEVVPVTSIDFRAVGDGRPGPITRRVAECFTQAAAGALPAYRRWLWPVGLASAKATRPAGQEVHA